MKRSFSATSLHEDDSPLGPVPRKLKLQASYATTSPFPSFSRPTHDDCHSVHDILVEAHGHRHRRTPSTTANSAATCGGVQNVLESVIGTILSQNTSGANSTRAKINLDQAFGHNNFNAIAEASPTSIVEAIKSGGLAVKKGATIQKLLHSVKAKHGDFSLQHLATASTSDGPLSNEEIMQELMSFDGVGPKTASCVLMFCLGRESFAVDTHVYRLSKLLGWVPAKADRVATQAHLDLRIPGELKYPLHVLMIEHGRKCRGCKDRGTGPCILKQHIRDKSKASSQMEE